MCPRLFDQPLLIFADEPMVTDISVLSSPKGHLLL